LLGEIAGKYAQPGDVIVVDAAGHTESACWGAGMTCGALQAGCAGAANETGIGFENRVAEWAGVLMLAGLATPLPASSNYAAMQLVFGISRIVLRLEQPQWQALLVPCPEVPRAVEAGLVRLDTALLDLRAVATDPASAPLPRAA